ncbi:MAG TPA: hypothetical protein VF705_08230 [Longimicrobium sp.]|jgi:hypothetical protein
MKIQDVRTAPERRTFANAATVIVVLALVSLVLEWQSGSDLAEITSSFATFAIILCVAVIRFRVRSSDPKSREKLWIVALWTAMIDLVARCLPGRADPPVASAPAAPESDSPAVPLRAHQPGDKQFGGRSGA